VPDIAITPLKPEHVTPEYVAWLNDPDVVRFTEARFQRHTLESTVAYVRAIDASPRDELLRILVEGAHVGNIKLTGIDRHHRRSSIGILIGRRDLWGRGIGPRAVELIAQHAFGRLALHKLVAGIYAENERSRKTFERAGFRLEAVLKDHRRFEDNFVDEMLLARLNTT
jgi:[ribosomal protein S5]-alanine N-acetyltransferase